MKTFFENQNPTCIKYLLAVYNIQGMILGTVGNASWFLTAINFPLPPQTPLLSSPHVRYLHTKVYTLGRQFYGLKM